MSNDLISRKAAIEQCKRHDDYTAWRIADGIESLPSVEAEPVRHGRRIPLEYDGYADGNPVWDFWECSECGEEHSGDEDTLTPYCPNCGAKMDLEDNK